MPADLQGQLDPGAYQALKDQVDKDCCGSSPRVSWLGVLHGTEKIKQRPCQGPQKPWQAKTLVRQRSQKPSFQELLSIAEAAWSLSRLGYLPRV